MSMKTKLLKTYISCGIKTYKICGYGLRLAVGERNVTYVRECKMLNMQEIWQDGRFTVIRIFKIWQENVIIHLKYVK
jgi:hypothetical protein